MKFKLFGVVPSFVPTFVPGLAIIVASLFEAQISLHAMVIEEPLRSEYGLQKYSSIAPFNNTFYDEGELSENLQKRKEISKTIQVLWPISSLEDSIFSKYEDLPKAELFLQIIGANLHKSQRIDFSEPENVESLLNIPLNELQEFINILNIYPLHEMNDSHSGQAISREEKITSQLVRSLSNKTLPAIKETINNFMKNDIDITLGKINAVTRLHKGQSQGVYQSNFIYGLTHEVVSLIDNIQPSPANSPAIKNSRKLLA